MHQLHAFEMEELSILVGKYKDHVRAFIVIFEVVVNYVIWI
jgi:hypothetical protein